MSVPLRFAAWTFAGVILLQAAWIVSVPPFRGIDEIDHAYLASAVASGQWRITEQAADGRGRLVEVPEDVVEAASPQCRSLPYTGPDNCRPVKRGPDGTVTVASSAAGYHPAFYVLPGVVSRPFEGATSDLAMRIVSALMCAIGIAAAAWSLASRFPGRWSRFGFVTALTPVLAYSSTLPAPNATEMAAGLCLWTSLLAGLSTQGIPSRARHLWLATVAACVLTTVRYIGPMWVGLIALTVVALMGAAPVAELVRRRKRFVVVGSAAVVMTGVASLSWTLSQGLLGTTQHREELPDDFAVELGSKPVVWLLQIIAAFPRRADAAAPAVYLIYVLVFLGLLTAGLMAAERRHRAVIVAVAVTVAVLPVVMTYVSADAHGVIWQGRYGLPFAVGLPILCGIALDARLRAAPASTARWATAGCALLGLAHGWSVVGVLLNEKSNPVSASDPAWLAPSAGLVVVLVVAAWSVLAAAVVRDAESSSEKPAHSTSGAEHARGQRS